jgi:MerR family transcriptional regulator, light-induced transcriptional regulator
MIDETTYDAYFKHLISGNKAACLSIVELLNNQDVEVESIYTHLFQRALYQVGDYWERNIISVATEHMATAITENMMIRLQPRLFTTDRTGKKAVVACIANEYHQVGAKMIADIFEMYGWDGYFIGANTPFNELIRFIEENKPDVIGLSLSIYFNIPELASTLSAIRSKFPETTIITGGQAFRWGGFNVIEKFNNIQFIGSIKSLEEFIRKETLA